MNIKKESWESPVTRIERFTPNEYCAGCTESVVIIDTAQPGFTWSWMMRDVTPTGLVVAANDEKSSLVPAPKDITYIHQIFGVEMSGSYYTLPGTSSQNGRYYTSTTFPNYTLYDSDGNGRIDSGDYLQVTIEGTTYSAKLNGDETAYSNPSAAYYDYVRNNS